MPQRVGRCGGVGIEGVDAVVFGADVDDIARLVGNGQAMNVKRLRIDLAVQPARIEFTKLARVDVGGRQHKLAEVGTCAETVIVLGKNIDCRRRRRQLTGNHKRQDPVQPCDPHDVQRLLRHRLPLTVLSPVYSVSKRPSHKASGPPNIGRRQGLFMRGKKDRDNVDTVTAATHLKTGWKSNSLPGHAFLVSSVGASQVDIATTTKSALAGNGGTTVHFKLLRPGSVGLLRMRASTRRWTDQPLALILSGSN